MKVLIKQHFELATTINLPIESFDSEVAAVAADEIAKKMQVKDLEWIGTYIEDEDGEELATIS